MPDCRQLNQVFVQSQPAEILSWALRHYWPDIAISSSFQTQSLPLLHMAIQVQPQVPVLFLDTGYHFTETLAFRDRIAAEWNLNLQIIRTALSRHEVHARHGAELYLHNPDLCCFIHKVEPMRIALQKYRAWISGIVPDQTASRMAMQVFEPWEHLVRIHPLAHWSRREVFSYIDQHQLPPHPLFARGYLSIGCTPCTQPVSPGSGERSGRWGFTGKTECGLHTQLRGPISHEPS